MSGHTHSASAAFRRPLAWVFCLVAAFAVAELWVGLASGSLALLAEAGHLATDAVGVGLALVAVSAGMRGSRGASRTFGHYRFEVLAALANAALLLGVAAFIAFEAITRLAHPADVAPVPMLVMGLAGLAVNGLSYRLLHAGSRESINVRGAALEVASDAVGSAGVVVGAVVLLTTGWPHADAMVALGIAAFVAPRALLLGRDALRILLQAAPSGVDVATVRRDLAAVDAVQGVHDLHIWTLTSGMNVTTVHLVGAPYRRDEVLAGARSVLDGHGLGHATVQVEGPAGEGCDGAQW